MQSTVVELSRYTADDKPTNAEWTNRLSKPVVLESGDYVMVKQAFVDTRLIDQTSILIEQDVQWTLQFMYWVNNCGINAYDLVDTDDYVMPDGLPYVLIDMPPGNDPTAGDTYSLPVVDDFTIHIPKGTYERSYLAEFITRQLQSINQPARRNYKDNAFSTDRIVPIHDPVDNGCIGFSKATVGPPQYQVITPFLRPVFFGNVPQPVPNNVIAESVVYTDNKANFRQGFLYPLTDNIGYAVSKNNLVLNKNWSQPILYNAEIETNAGPTIVDLYDGGYIGASQVSFVYNDSNGDNRFSFQYIHTPLMDGGNESVGMYINNTLPNPGVPNFAMSESVFMNAYSGIMFVNTYTNLSDDPTNDPFLKQLGFSYDDIVCPNIKKYFSNDNRPMVDAIYRPLNYYNDFLPYTTRNLMTLGSIISGSTQSKVGSHGASFNITNNSSIFSAPPYNTTEYYFTQSSVTAGIAATNIPTASNTSAGHYLVELQCSYVTEYVNQEKNYQVKAIIGNYFLSGDSFCMSMGPDSFMHQHNGVPLSISNIKVRLLNPVTKQPADNLGANSTIYLQITKEKPQLPLEDTKTKPDKKDDN